METDMRKKRMSLSACGTIRRTVTVLVLVMLSILPLCADEMDRGIGTLHMAGSVARSFGVDIPDGATLIGNLLIEYSYDGENWVYVSDAYVDIPNLGLEPDSVSLRASYYGNEPSDYNCDVVFSTGGWNRSGGRSISTYDARSLVGNGFNNEESDLPISFDDLTVYYDSGVASHDISTGTTGIEVIPGDGGNSFSIFVPVQDPINGYLVAELQASWGAKDLPSGEYYADIQVEVSANS